MRQYVYTSPPCILHSLHHQYSKFIVAIHDGQVEWGLLLIVFGHGPCIMIQQTPPNIHKSSHSGQMKWSVAVRASSGDNGPTMKQSDHKLLSLTMYTKRFALYLPGNTHAVIICIHPGFNLHGTQNLTKYILV